MRISHGLEPFFRIDFVWAEYFSDLGTNFLLLAEFHTSKDLANRSNVSARVIIAYRVQHIEGLWKCRSHTQTSDLKVRVHAVMTFRTI